MNAEEIFQRFTKSTQEAAMRLRVRSALNPCLWLCGIVGLPCLAGGLFADDGLRVFLSVVGCMPVVIFGLGFVYFMLKDPDKLQSEEYQIQKRALELIEEKGGRIPISPASIESITNPRLRQIGSGEESGR